MYIIEISHYIHEIKMQNTYFVSVFANILHKHIK